MASNYDETVKTVVRDLLNYATAVQNYFNIRQRHPINSTPINDCLSDEDKVSRYSDDMLVTTAPDAPKVPENTNLSCIWKTYSTVNLDAAISINFFAEPGKFAGMLYWTEAAYNSTETLSFANKSNVFEVSSRNMPVNGNDEETSSATVGGIYAKDIADLHYVCMYAGSADSYTYSTVKVDSVAYYLTRMIQKITEEGYLENSENDYLLQACQNMLAYGDSAKAYADGN